MKNLSKYVLLDVVVIDGKGNEPIAKRAVVVEGKIIKEILPVEKAKNLSGYQFIEMDGLTLIPGLIDCHVHLNGLIGDRINAYTIPGEVRMLRSAKQAMQLLSYGFTSVRDISHQGLYLKRVIHKGELLGPRIVACGRGLTRTGGHGEIAELPLLHAKDPNYGAFADIADGVDEIRKTIRWQFRQGADQIKFWATGGGYSTTDRIDDVHYNVDEIRTIIEETKLIKGAMVCCHAEELEAIKTCVELGVNSIEHGEELDEETVKMMVKKNTYFVPTLRLVANWYIDRYDPKSTIPDPIAIQYGPYKTVDFMAGTEDIDPYKNRDKIYDNFNLARENGVKIAVGSDSIFDNYTEFGRYSISEMQCFVEAGMSSIDSIRAATSVGAEVLGIDKYVGTIEPGKLADMVLVKGSLDKNVDALADKANIKYVFKEGRLTVNDGNLVNFGEVIKR